MNTDRMTIGIETSGRRGSIAVGRGAQLLETATLAEQRRHGVALLPTLDALANRHGFTPSQIGEVYLSIGPGSFTGLRVAVTVAKMLTRVTGCKLVAVPTLDVVIENAPTDAWPVAVMLNAKSGRWFTGIYDRQDGRWVARATAALLTAEQVIDQTGQAVTIIADQSPLEGWPEGVRVLDGAYAQPRAEIVWRIGQTMGSINQWTEARDLIPLYVRLPDAEETWRKRQSKVPL